MDIYDFYTGSAFDVYEYLGTHLAKDGTIFRTYAPNALKVSLIGDFSQWEDIPMKKLPMAAFMKYSALRQRRVCDINSESTTERVASLITAIPTASAWRFAPAPVLLCVILKATNSAMRNG